MEYATAMEQQQKGVPTWKNAGAHRHACLLKLNLMHSTVFHIAGLHHSAALAEDAPFGICLHSVTVLAAREVDTS